MTAVLNVAAMVATTRALGPGRRAVVWVQGCPFDCAGCVAPDWIPDAPARLVTAAELAAELCADESIDGLTFSGGEPMMQAAGLAEVARLARERLPGLSLICFTGFRLERLRRTGSPAAVEELLAEVDVLVDGPYVAALNDNRGLRGSSNQRVHHLTDRLRGFDFEGPRRAEVRLGTWDVLVVGVPPHGLLTGLDTALAAAARGVTRRQRVPPGAAQPARPAPMPAGPGARHTSPAGTDVTGTAGATGAGSVATVPGPPTNQPAGGP